MLFKHLHACHAGLVLCVIFSATSPALAQEQMAPGFALGSIATIEQDSTGPIVRAPSWWPRKKTHQNVAFLLAAGTVGFGIIWILPEDISKWDKSIPMSVYLKQAYTRPPVWDKDEWYWNYLVHPVTGMWVYLMERNHGRRPVRGFLLSTAASVGWEYGFEAFIERPSIQDLIFTSTVGSVFGELVYKLTLSMKEDGFTGLERVVLTVLNPAYPFQYGYR